MYFGIVCASAVASGTAIGLLELFPCFVSCFLFLSLCLCMLHSLMLLTFVGNFELAEFLLRERNEEEMKFYGEEM